MTPAEVLAIVAEQKDVAAWRVAVNHGEIVSLRIDYTPELLGDCDQYTYAVWPSAFEEVP